MTLALLVDEAPAYPAGATVELPIGLLDGDNYRTDSDASGDVTRLTAAIAAEGRVHAPILVRPGDCGRYVIISGHHRSAAVRSLGWPTIPATICGPMDAGAHLLAAVADNECRRDATILETAEAFGRLVEAGYSPDEIATACARTIGYVTRRLALLAIDPIARPVVAGRGLSFADALADLPADLQRECVRHLDADTTAGAWSRICQRARELAYERAQSCMFDASAFELQAETWSVELGRYVDELAAEPERPVAEIVRDLPLGVAEVAERLGVKAATVAKWRERPWTGFPAPDVTIAAGPLWWAATVDQWAAATGRGHE